jgi:DNA-binding response OmpR family regulator
MGHTRPLILVVEDDPLIAELLATVFAERGYLAHIAPGVAEVLSILETVRPAVITLDVGLPRSSGLDLLQAIREDPTTRDLAVLLISALPEVAFEARHLVQGVITKPFALEAVLRSVEQLMAMDDPPLQERALGA